MVKVPSDVEAPSTRMRILNAAIEVVAVEGLGASTASIAKRAGVAHGSVFKHFPRKVELLNAIYLEIKDELNAIVVGKATTTGDVWGELRSIWDRWIQWGVANPHKMATVQLLNSSHQITQETRDSVKSRMAVGVTIFELAAIQGVFAGKPIEFIGKAIAGIALATIEAIGREPEHAADYGATGFSAVCNLLK